MLRQKPRRPEAQTLPSLVGSEMCIRDSIQVAENEYVTKGTLLGYVSEPTKYYSIEGNNVYFELMHEGQPVDALDYLE